VKVIFIEDVHNVARAGTTKEVANGYARNYLFPKKLAVLAESPAAAAAQAHIKKVVQQRAILEAEMTEIAKKIAGVEVTFKAKAGERDKLYGSVTVADIAAELTKIAGREIDKRKVELAEPIRQIGVYDVTIRFTHEITTVMTAIVMSDAEGAAVPTRATKAEAAAEEAKAEKKEKKAKAPKEKKPKAEKATEGEPSAEAEPAVEKPADVKEAAPAPKKAKAKAKKTEESTEAKE
jgi:large subunit ribosomal protein L9